MGRHAAAQRRGSNRPGETGQVLAPVLRLDDPDVLQWTWDMPDPTAWRFYTSVDGVSDWEVYDSPPGTDRSYEPAPNLLFWQMQGINDDDDPVTGFSNIVHMANG